MHDPIAIAVAVLAVALAGLSKGGFAGVGMLSTPLLALVMPPVQAASVMLPILLIQDAYSVASYRKTIDWHLLRLLFPGAVVGVGGGYLVASALPPGAVALTIGVISVVFALRTLIGTSGRDRPAPRRDVAAGSFWGMLSGFTSMIAHAGSPPFQIYVLPQKLAVDVFVGTSVMFFAAVNWAKVLPYLLLGQLTRDTLAISSALIPLALLATWAGIRLVRMIDPDRFYGVIHTLLALVGVKLIHDGLSAMHP